MYPLQRGLNTHSRVGVTLFQMCSFLGFSPLALEVAAVPYLCYCYIVCKFLLPLLGITYIFLVNSYCVWICVSPQESYIEILILSVTVLVSGTFRWWLGNEGRTLMNEINAFIRETPDSYLSPFCHIRIQEVWDPTMGLHLTILAPWPWTSDFKNSAK